MSTTLKQAIDGFLLSCKVEGKSHGTIECYSDKLKGLPTVILTPPPELSYTCMDVLLLKIDGSNDIIK